MNKQLEQQQTVAAPRPSSPVIFTRNLRHFGVDMVATWRVLPGHYLIQLRQERRGKRISRLGRA